MLITGASGWLGLRLLHSAVERGMRVRGSVRRSVSLGCGIDLRQVPSLDSTTPWGDALKGCQVVIHAAARVHLMNDASADPLSEYRLVNVQGTINLARQAADAGIRRFIFLSSVKVNGERTEIGQPFRADDVPSPQDAYGISKMEAEMGLRAIALQTGMEVVIIRPPLVYGPGVKANFAEMVKWLQRGVPLPLGAIQNRRSLVALDNLVDLILTCIHHPLAANQTFLVSDGEDISTSELLRRMALALGRPARLISVPQQILESAALLLGKEEMAKRLFSSLQVNPETTCRLLNWTPPLTLEQGLLRVAKGI